MDKEKRKRPSNWCVEEKHRLFVAGRAKAQGVSESEVARAVFDAAIAAEEGARVAP